MIVSDACAVPCGVQNARHREAGAAAEGGYRQGEGGVCPHQNIPNVGDFQHHRILCILGCYVVKGEGRGE